LEPIGPEGPVSKYIERKGEGMHHLAFGVNDIQKALEVLREKGIPLIDEKPKMGAGGTKTAFLHPKGTKVLMELVEH
jgi:methylmalonyl-CoA/ethylmalonyl-CoA epimerase